MENLMKMCFITDYMATHLELKYNSRTILAINRPVYKAITIREKCEAFMLYHVKCPTTRFSVSSIIEEDNIPRLHTTLLNIRFLTLIMQTVAVFKLGLITYGWVY